MNRVYVLVNLVVVILLFAACAAPGALPAGSEAEQASQASEAGEPTEAEKEGGTLIIGTPAVVQFDPIFVADDPSFHVVSNIFSLLFRAQDDELIPDLATSWEYEDDATLIFHLREGVMWHDDNAVFPAGQSREVVASDVVYSIERAINTEGNLTWGDLVESFESVEALDDHTVRLRLKHPNAILFARARGLSGLAIVPQEAVEQLGEDFALNPIGSGPFKFVEYRPDDSVTLVRNELYWKRPYLDGVVYKILPDADVALIALEAGEIDLYNGTVPDAEVDRLQTDENVILYPSPCPVMTQLVFNFNVPLFGDVQFREAVARAIDGDAINANIRRSAHASGAGTAGPGVPGYDPELRERYFQYDPEEAKSILAELGWEDSDGNGVLDKDGEPMQFVLEIWDLSPMPRYGEAIITQLQQVGIPAELETVEFGTFIDDWNAGVEKAMMMGGWCGDGGTNGLWGRGSFAGSMGFADEEVFALLDESNRIVDAEQRDQLIREAADKIYGQYAAVPMGFFYFFNASRPWVKDFHGTLWFENLVTEQNNVWLDRDK
jgi:ABC-type transport system substrate-binding protein